MTCSPNYPASFPMDCVTSFITILKSGSITTSVKELVAAGYELEGYLLSLYPGAPAAVVNGLPPVEEHKALLREAHTLLLDEMTGGAAATAEPVGSQLTVFVHTVLVPYLKSLLEMLLAHLG